MRLMMASHRQYVVQLLLGDRGRRHLERLMLMLRRLRLGGNVERLVLVHTGRLVLLMLLLGL